MDSISSRTKLIIALTSIFLIMGIIVGVIFFKNSQVEPLTTQRTDEASSGVEEDADNSESGMVVDDYEILELPSVISRDGVTYSLRNDIKTFLFLGFDEEEFTQYMFLFVLDDTNKNIRVVKIPSDLITDVSVYNDDRELLETSPMEIGKQYAYGESNARSSFLTRSLVSSVMKGTRIDYYFSISLDGLCIVVDTLEAGKVDIGLRNDWTDLNPDYTLDTIVSLNGEEVKEFFEFTGMNQYDSDKEHLTRRDWFMLSLFSGIVKSSGSDDFDAVMDAAEGLYETDMDAEILKQYKNYEMVGSVVIPYEYTGDSMDELILDLFYTE